MNKKFILKPNEAIQALYKVGKKLNTKNLMMLYQRNEIGHLQIVFAVSKKNGNSPERNRMRRRLKAIVSKSTLTTTSYDILINVRKEFMNVDHKTLVVEVSELIKKFLSLKT